MAMGAYGQGRAEGEGERVLTHPPLPWAAYFEKFLWISVGLLLEPLYFS